MLNPERQENWKQIFLDYESVNDDDPEIMNNIKEVIEQYKLSKEHKYYYESLAFFLDLYPDYDNDSHFLD